MNILEDQHTAMVTALVKPPEAIFERISPDKCALLHPAIGIAGEAGEIIDAVKKVVIYNQELDRKNLVEELGDMEFYLKDLRLRTSITREECLAANIKKLAIRYENFLYTDAQAKERKDKQ